MSRALYQSAEKRLGSMERVRQCGGPVRQCDGAAHNAIDADPRTFVLDLRTFVLDLRTPHRRPVAPYVSDPACRRSTHWQGATQEDRIRTKVENKK
jgi:hypothetical protein